MTWRCHYCRRNGAWPGVAFGSGIVFCVSMARASQVGLGCCGHCVGHNGSLVGTKSRYLYLENGIYHGCQTGRGHVGSGIRQTRQFFAVERWLLADGDGAKLTDAAKRQGWTCADDVCLAKVKNKTVIWLGRNTPPADCKTADIVVSANPLRRLCGYPSAGKVHIDRFDVWRNGAHAVKVEKGGTIAVNTARGLSGQRLWTYEPVARRKMLVKEPPPWQPNPSSQQQQDQ